MIKDLYFYVILAFIAVYFYCYKYHSCGFVEGYRDAKIYIGQSPFVRNDIINLNDNDFGSHSVYEFGTIMPTTQSPSKEYHPNYYPGYYPYINFNQTYPYF